MPTWTAEFRRLSEIERATIDEWRSKGNAANAIIDAKEATNPFLIKY